MKAIEEKISGIFKKKKKKPSYTEVCDRTSKTCKQETVCRAFALSAKPPMCLPVSPPQPNRRGRREGGVMDGRSRLIFMSVFLFFLYGKHKLASMHSNYGPDSGSSAATDCSMWRQNVGTRGQLRPGV